MHGIDTSYLAISARLDQLSSGAVIPAHLSENAYHAESLSNDLEVKKRALISSHSEIAQTIKG